ncbi:MAG: hypothetical protein AAFY11_11195, partial [Cyanobacteria bacterium J06641_5]
SRVFICSLLGLGAVPAIATVTRAEVSPFTVIRANDSYFCRTKNQCTATVEAQNGDRYRVKYGGPIAIDDGDLVLVETVDRIWVRLSLPETNQSANVIGQTPLR